mmetsp:Transcript_9155/g.22069  ORF Transcript_9155/g.22069 Transcript_9155/m.22069 type:complete len:272 (+) Transcript_9155:864-1679(+)
MSARVQTVSNRSLFLSLHLIVATQYRFCLQNPTRISGLEYLTERRLQSRHIDSGIERACCCSAGRGREAVLTSMGEPSDGGSMPAWVALESQLVPEAARRLRTLSSTLSPEGQPSAPSGLLGLRRAPVLWCPNRAACTPGPAGQSPVSSCHSARSSSSRRWCRRRSWCTSPTTCFTATVARCARSPIILYRSSCRRASLVEFFMGRPPSMTLITKATRERKVHTAAERTSQPLQVRSCVTSARRPGRSCPTSSNTVHSSSGSASGSSPSGS